MRPTGAGALSELRYHSGRPTDPRHRRENLTCPPPSTSTRSASGSAWASSRAQAGRSPRGSSGGSSPISERKRQRARNLFGNLPEASTLVSALAACRLCRPAVRSDSAEMSLSPLRLSRPPPNRAERASAQGQTETSRQRDGTAGLPSTADIFGECRHDR